jgi:hypothetical protein
VLISEQIVRRSAPDPAAETELQRALIQNGFRIVDLGQSEKLDAREWLLNANRSRGLSTADILQLATRFRADVLVTGEAFAEEVPAPPELARNGFKVYSARLEVKVLDLATAQVITSGAYTANAIGLSDLVTGKAALENAARKAALDVPGKLANWASGRSAIAGRAYAVRLDNVPSYAALNNLIARLKNAANVTTVTSRQFDSVGAALEVQFTGPPENLAALLETLGLEVTGLSAGEVRAVFKR